MGFGDNLFNSLCGCWHSLYRELILEYNKLHIEHSFEKKKPKTGDLISDTSYFVKFCE